MMNTIAERVQQIIKDMNCHTLDDFDSIDWFEFEMRLEDVFSVELKGETDMCATVDNVVKMLTKKGVTND